MSNTIVVGGVEIAPEFFESHVKFAIPSGEPLDGDIKKEISLQFDIPVLFEHYHGKQHISRTWYSNGVNHCPFGEPAHEERGATIRIVRHHNKDGVMENKVGPARIHISSSLYSEQWFEDGAW